MTREPRARAERGEGGRVLEIRALFFNKNTRLQLYSGNISREQVIVLPAVLQRNLL